jgi:hypothetical protein
MFRAATGFKGQYRDFWLIVAADFDEWRVILQGPGVTIQGGRQFSEAKAKEQAVKVADSYVTEIRKEPPGADGDVDWKPLQPGEWMNWRP